MEDNKNENQTQTTENNFEEPKQGSVFLTQIKEKRAQYNQKKRKPSVFSQFIDPSSNQNKTQSKTENKPKKGVPILGILAGVAILFLLFVVLMVAVVAVGDANNSLLVAFGIDESRLKEVLLFIVNGSFGIVAFAMLLVFVISMFRVSLLKKEEKEKRKKVLKHLFFSLFFLIFVLVTWFGSWKTVNGMKTSTPLTTLEINTVPAEVKGLVAPVEISFDASEVINGLSARGSEPESLGWDFDEDGEYEVTSDDEMLVLHRFEQEGSINVGLIINLADGTTQTFSKLIEIAKAEFTANPSSGSVPLKVTLDASRLERAETPAASFEWDFDGDGSYDEKQADAITEYTFDKIGVYNVGLRIVDIHNNFRVYSKKIEVSQDTTEKLKARIKVSPSQKGIAPFKLSMNGTDSTSLDGEIREYEWDFGDNSGKQYGRTVSYTYKKPGVYNVTLTVYNEDDAKDSDSIEIEVQGDSFKPVAKIETTPVLETGKEVLEGVIPFSVHFDASKSEDGDDNIIEYAWDLDNDGTYDDFGQKVSHIFEQEGNYEVTLKITDSDNHSSESKIAIRTKTRELQAILLAEPLSGAVPLKVDFDASTSIYKKGKIVTYEWDFGDGGGAEYGDAKRTHIYDKEGRYTVKIKVIAEDGTVAEASRDIFVRALQLQACFSSDPKTGKAPLTVAFDASCTQGEVAKWKWDFGDGFISTSYSPMHTFNQKGEYTVSLELVDEKNNSSEFKSVIVVE